MEKIIKEIENKLNIKIISYSLLGKGQCNNVYKLKTKDRNICLKIAKGIGTTCELNNISIEALVFDFITKAKVPFISTFIFHSNDYYLYEFIDGMSMKEIFPKLSDRQKVSIFKKIGNFHHALSQHSKKDVLDLGITEYQPERNKLNPEQVNLGRLNNKQKELIKSTYKIYLNTIQSSKPQLLHNDAHDENIFIVLGKPVFIDFGDMIWRDIHYDFSRYVHDYPKYWKIILSQFEKLSETKLDQKRIIAVSLLRHLEGFILDIKNGDDFDKELKYYSRLLI